jgi:hypothetical protein
MPRQTRLDSPGTLHHVIVRGIEKRPIVDDETDRSNFVRRLGALAKETIAWGVVCSHHSVPGARELSDERILGSGEFVERILGEADHERCASMQPDGIVTPSVSLRRNAKRPEFR